MKASEYKPLPKFATELRIGNYYRWLHEEHETYHKADVEFIKTQLHYETDPCADEFSRGWWAAPVELNEEWLIKLGFEKPNYRPDGNEDWSVTYDLEHVHLSGFDIYIHRIEQREDLMIGKQDGKYYYIGEFAGYDEEAHIYSLSNGFEYVHQLMNLYHALTGEELNLKE